MIYLAGSLDLNGGSTFLLRVARENSKAGKKVDIVVLSSVIGEEIRAELAQYATVIELAQLVDKRFAWCGTNQVALFFPLNRLKLEKLLAANDGVVHAMGIFGLIYAYRLANQFGGIKVTAGVYQQNEFLSNAALFFVRQSNKMFASLPIENVVFFNEYNRIRYTQVFKKSYANSPLLPIGVVLPKMDSKCDRPVQYGRLVSVGNLVDFKTYNEHVIRTVALLAQDYPQLRYDIYGEGDQFGMLTELIAELKLELVVKIHKRFPYAEFRSIVEGAMGFIGSGTALLEAAALHVPSIVGIESIKTPETYGFLSDVKGFSYNELIPGERLVSIQEVIRKLLRSDSDELERIGAQCANKAAEFSIEKTIDGFNQLTKTARITAIKMSFIFKISFFLSFLWLAILDGLYINRKFRMRRDQQ